MSAGPPAESDRYRDVSALARSGDLDIEPILPGSGGTVAASGGTSGAGSGPQPPSAGTNTAVSISRTRTVQAGSVSVVGLADSEPAEGTGLTVFINDTIVFSGTISSAERDGRGVLVVTAYDAKRTLRQASFTGSFTDRPAVEIAAQVCNRAGVPITIEYEDDDDRPTVTHDFDGMTSARALTKLAEWTNSVWWIDARNGVRFGPDAPVTAHDLDGVLTSQAGAQEPGYQKIVIVGGGSQSGSSGGSGGGGGSGGSGGGGGGTDGDRRRPRASKDPVRGVAGDENADEARTYRHRRPSITTQEVAQNVADSVWRRYQRQRATGTIELAGRPGIHPFDVVTLPDHVGSGESYAVENITQMIDKDGYRSVVKCDGQVTSDSGSGGGSGPGGGGGSNVGTTRGLPAPQRTLLRRVATQRIPPTTAQRDGIRNIVSETSVLPEAVEAQLTAIADAGRTDPSDAQRELLTAIADTGDSITSSERNQLTTLAEGIGGSGGGS